MYVQNDKVTLYAIFLSFLNSFIKLSMGCPRNSLRAFRRSRNGGEGYVNIITFTGKRFFCIHAHCMRFRLLSA